MGVSTDGQICYGILFEEGFEFPWDDGPYEDLEEWWVREVCGYKNPIEIFDEEGEFLEEFDSDSPETAQYFDSLFKFTREHPLPVVEVNCCSGDVPIYILAVPSTCRSASRGDPLEIRPEELAVSVDEYASLIEFCSSYIFKTFVNVDPPRWYLSSLWM